MASELHQRIRAAMDYAGLTHGQLAKHLGVTRPNVTLMVRAKPEQRVAPSAKQIQIISRATGVPMAWLMDDTVDAVSVWELGDKPQLPSLHAPPPSKATPGAVPAPGEPDPASTLRRLEELLIAGDTATALLIVQLLIRATKA